MKSKSPNRTLITGGTGFLGRTLLEYLLEHGEKHLRVLTTSCPDWLRELDCEIVEGSLSSPELVKVAVDGVRQIYHLAGKVSRTSEDQRSMFAVHVDGTRILCEAALQASVKRIVMASSSGTVAVTEDGYEIPDETWPVPVEIIAKLPYYASKWYQEKTARFVCGETIDLIVMNPSLLLGPGDDRLSSTQDILKFLAGDIPAIPSGGMNFVDVRDVAPVFHNAMKRGEPGERYLLGGPNWTLERFFQHLERVSKASAPKLRVPRKLHTFTSKAIEAIYDGLGRKPPVEPISMEMSRYFWYVNSEKAKRELGFAPRDPGETLYDTVQYIRRHYLGDGILST